jgi:hypothetical protein
MARYLEEQRNESAKAEQMMQQQQLYEYLQQLGSQGRTEEMLALI